MARTGQVEQRGRTPVQMCFPKGTSRRLVVMGKLLPKIEGGGGAGCPILVFGISCALYEEDKEEDK